jgi:hypothetical protein
LLRKPLTDCRLRRKRREIEIALLVSFILMVVGCVALAERSEQCFESQETI